MARMTDYSDADIAGVPIAFLDEGSGDAVVLIHGFASSAAVNWRSTGWMAAITGSGRRAIAPDNRGHGRSRKFYDPADYRTEAMAEDTIGLLDRLGVRRADVIGYSMGARIGAAMALRDPGLVRSLVMAGIGIDLIAGNPNADAIAAALEADAPMPEIGETERGSAASRNGRAATVPRSQPPCEVRRGGVSARSLEGLAVPVLLATGSADKLAGSVAELAEHIPGAEILVIEGKDHMQAVGDRGFKAGVLDFLRRRP